MLANAVVEILSAEAIGLEIAGGYTPASRSERQEEVSVPAIAYRWLRGVEAALKLAAVQLHFSSPTASGWRF